MYIVNLAYAASAKKRAVRGAREHMVVESMEETGCKWNVR